MSFGEPAIVDIVGVVCEQQFIPVIGNGMETATRWSPPSSESEDMSSGKSSINTSSTSNSVSNVRAD